MESSNSNSKEKELQHMQQEERKLHSKCMERFNILKSHLINSIKKDFEDYTRWEPQAYRLTLIVYFNELERLFDVRARLIEDLRMKEREVNAIKEVEKWLNECKMQTQESLVTEDATLEASLFIEGQTDQTLRMLLPKEDNVNMGKHGLGFENKNNFENPSLLNKAKELAPSLYNTDEMGKCLLSHHKIISEE
nr:hypothetical protein [Tanacetum cinerariifolium]